jgi:predicted permease
METFKEHYRDQQGVPALEHLLQDVRVAVRRMWKTPGFTAAAIATLALGLGLTSAVMSLAYALFLRPLPVDEAARLVLVDTIRPDRPVTSGFGFSYPDYLYYRDHARAFSELAAHYSTSPMSVVTPGGPVSVSGAVVTANYFTLLRLTPRAGRFFSVEEDRVPGRDPVAILSYDFWRTRFAEDPHLLGTTVRINGTPFTVIGIAPEHFHGVHAGFEPNAVWIPTAMFGVGYRYCDALSRACAMVGVVGRLGGDTSIDQAQAEMAGLARQLEAAYPETNKGRTVLVRPARGIRIQEQATNAPIAALLAAAAALVLLVASANVAGLLLARGLRRRKEIAIRLAIGASRGRLIRLLLVESVILAAAGGVAGLQIAVWAADVLGRYFLHLDLSLDPRIALIGSLVALFTGVATGIAPALQSTRPDMALAMKEGSSGAGRPRSIVREGLIVVQVALSVLLLGAGGLLVRSFFMLHRGPGFDPDRVAIVRLRPSLVGFTHERAWVYQREVIERLEALPGVLAASPAIAPASWRAQPVTPARLPGDSSDPAQAYQVGTTLVGPRYFKTLGVGVGVVQGREFDDRDTMDGPRVAIVNETLARHFWPNGGAFGSVMIVGPDRVEVVGVVKDLQWTSALQQADPVAYLNFWQQDRGNRVAQDSRTHISVAGDANAMLAEIQRTIAAVDPDVPMSEAGSLGARLDSQFANVRAARTMLVTFGALALGLSMIGLYAALAFAVGERTREIAVRLALGASRADVGSLVFRRGMAIVSLGITVGVAACVIAGPFLAHLLYGVSPRDPLAIAAGPAVLIVVAALAISLPARRAMQQNPIIALRAE